MTIRSWSNLVRRTTNALNAFVVLPDWAEEVQSFENAAELWESLRTVGLSDLKVDV